MQSFEKFEFRVSSSEFCDCLYEFLYVQLLVTLKFA